MDFPFTRISVSASARLFSNWPVGRTKMRSSAVVKVPALATAFCVLIAWAICCGETPSRVSCVLEISM
ncbi:hypothetical protein G6F68_013951 [Rhizopus microsporus]|nr:hypothetical protein G6F68_013951 [Rhizopus microsporus]